MSKVSIQSVSILLLVFGLGISTLVGQSTNQPTSTIKLIDEDFAPIEGALISSTTMESNYISDHQGMASLPAGTYQITQLGYQMQSITIDAPSQTVIQLAVDPIILGRITVNAQSVAAQLIDEPSSIAILTDLQIKSTNLPQYSTLMNSVPGVFMHSGSINTNRITIRGIGSRSPFDTEKIRAYLGNIPLTNGSGQSTIEDLDLNFIGQIDLLKGPNGSQYGSGLGGTLLLSPEKLGYQQNLLSLNTAVGSYGTSILGLKAGFSNERHQFLVGLQRTTSDGYRDNNELSRTAATVTHSYQKERFSMQSIGYVLQQKAFIPSSLSASNVAEDPRQAAFTWGSAKGYEDYQKILLGTNLNFALSEQTTLLSSVFGSYFNNDEPRPFNILKEQTIGGGTRNRLIRTANQNTLIIGQEYFIDRHQFQTLENLYRENNGNGSLEGQLLSDLQETRQYLNVFGQNKYVFNNGLSIQAGLNLNLTRYELIDQFNPGSSSLSGDYQFDPILSPSLNVSYQLKDAVQVYGSLNHGFSPPTLEETLTPSGTINPAIEPETGYQLEVGLKKFSQRAFLSISAYQLWVDNLLVARRTAEDQFIGINAGRSNHMGLELAVNYKWVSGRNFSLTQIANSMLGRFRFTDFIDESNDFSDNRLPGVPELNVYNELQASYKKWSVVLKDQVIGGIWIDDANTVLNDAYHLLHGQLNYGFDLWEFQINCGLSVNNLMNTSYNSMVLVNAVGFNGSEPRYYYPGMPRNYLFHLNIKWL